MVRPKGQTLNHELPFEFAVAVIHTGQLAEPAVELTALYQFHQPFFRRTVPKTRRNQRWERGRQVDFGQTLTAQSQTRPYRLRQAGQRMESASDCSHNGRVLALQTPIG